MGRRRRGGSDRKALAAARAEQERQRKARGDAMLARRAGFEYPHVGDEATEFANEFTKANLLNFLYDALDAPAADTYEIDSGYDVSTHATRADETNRERTKRGGSLSGLVGQPFEDHGIDREPGTLGDLFEAPTGNTRATYISGAGFDAESWDDAWYDRWALTGLAYAYVIAGLVLRDDIESLQVIAGVPLPDIEVDKRLSFDGVADDVLSLAREALHAWTEEECPLLDPSEVVDMDAPVSSLPQLLLATRHSWDRTERLALEIAGLDPVDTEDLVYG